MNDPMTILKADHREAKQMMTALADSEEGKERNALAAELEKALTLHMAIEEDTYPLVAEKVGVEDEEERGRHGPAREVSRSWCRWSR